jgi:hypothetical protein
VVHAPSRIFVSPPIMPRRRGQERPKCWTNHLFKVGPTLRSMNSVANLRVTDTLFPSALNVECLAFSNAESLSSEEAPSSLHAGLVPML